MLRSTVETNRDGCKIAQLADTAIRDFIDRLGSHEPAPGGGAAAGVALALGAAMIQMAGGYSIGKRKYADVQEDLVAIVARCEAIATRGVALAAEDATAYAGFATAMKLPRKSPEEKAARSAALAEAARAATVVPLDLAELCAEVVALGEQTCRIGNPNLVGDAAGGGSLARGALRICQLNIAANVGMIVDDAFVQDTESRLAAAAKSLRQADITVDRHL